MEWRCEWCGKPHEENDPPCDNCGHSSFEKAVVQQPEESDGGPDSTTVWVCTECGRTHTKHAPPCSRCGNHKLVREQQRVEESELTAPGYLDLLTPRYAVGLVAVLGLATIFVLGVTGVIALPGFGTGVPNVENVPGSATSAGNLSLADVEGSYLDEIDSAREDAGPDPLTREEDLDEVATFIVQRNVKADYGDGERPSSERVNDLLDERCQGSREFNFLTRQGGNYTTAAGLAESFAAESTTGSPEATSVGVDIHTAPDGTVYLAAIIC